MGHLVSLWAGTPGVTFESLLGHFNSFCVSVGLGGRPLHNPYDSSRKERERERERDREREGEGLTSGKIWLLFGRSREPLRKSGKLLGNLWMALKIHCEQSSGEVAGEALHKLGEIWRVQGVPEALGSLAARECSQRRAKNDLQTRLRDGVPDSM